MPKKLAWPQMIQVDTDLVVIGGSDGNDLSSSLFRLTCRNGDFKWHKMSQELMEPRFGFVAMAIPDNFPNSD